MRFALNGLPSVWELHDIPQHFSIYQKAVEKSLKIIAITYGIADKLKSLGVSEDKIIVAPDGVDLSKFKTMDKQLARQLLNLDANKIIILYTGQLFEWKGIDTLIEAAVGLPNNIEVVIVGGGERLKELKNRAEAIKSPCRFIGQVKHNEIPDYLGSADIIAIPNSAKTEISRRYTSPLKLFEAMAAKRPIIASNLLSIREILDEKSAILIEPDNAGALQDSILRLADDPILQTTLANNAYQKVQGYSWQARAKFILSQITK